MLHQASWRANMQGRFKPERPNLSHTDLHPEITKGGKDVSPESSWEHKKQHADIKANDEEELVKYMSKLPSYLERGAKKPQEKVLNVGVLEWGRLEKWQGSHKQISHRTSISSLSSSNTSSSLSTDESSARSSTGHSCSPGNQRLQRPSLESHPMSVPKKGHLQFVKPFRESGGKFQDLKTTQRSTFTVQEKFIREKSSCKSNPHIKPDKFKRREMLPKIVSESVTVPSGVKDNMASCEKDEALHLSVVLASAWMSSTCSSAKTKPENLVASGVDTSCGDKLNAKSRARSSPLRRLIEPLLKPKAVNCRSFTNQLQESIITEGGCKSSERTRHSTMTMQPAKVKSDTTSTMVNDSALNKKCGSSAVQALLRVQVKNGLPLFTFAVDNESNILAATVKMLSSSSKGDYGCIYTFFAVKEVRKKNGMWINQGGKGKGQDYAPKIVAQMKVSVSEFSHLSRPNYVDQFSIREFVLLTLDVGQAHTQASDSQPNDEQAAIIVKIPKKNSRNSIRDGYLIDKRQSLPEATSKECLPDVKLELNSGKKDSFEGVRNINATVILPSGVHSLPNKGEPSSLIQRWKSGGACDCGGWDLGCKLRILSNKSQCNQRPSSLRGSSISNQFELFFQGGAQDNMPFFSLASFNDGIYSVEFNSSLSLVQAFSICIAVWDSGNHFELSESVPLYEERTLGETILNDGTNEPNQIEGEGPARQWSVRYLSPMKNKKISCVALVGDYKLARNNRDGKGH
ncbi:hypothetical protein GOBAR_DD12545 [Gossypium barbadense]|nr:hypothetical protein GOBAR_DD12545 [Gossypium barbadense]